MCYRFIKLKQSSRKSPALIFTIIFCFAGLLCTAQKFKPDNYGYVAAPEFKELIKQKGYQLVSAFDTIPDRVVATVLKDNKPYYLDLNGNELPYVDGNAGQVKVRDNWREKPFNDAKAKYRQLTGINKMYQKNHVGTLYGLIRRRDNAVILPPDYQSIEAYSANFVIIKKDGKYGAADTSGKVFIKPQYDYLEACMVDTAGIDMFIATKDGLATLVNRSGKEMFPPKYNKIVPFIVDGALYSIGSENGQIRYGLLGKEGKILLEPYCRDFVNIPYSNFLRTEKTGNSNELGLASKQGKIILEPVYGYVSIAIDDGFIHYSKGSKQGLVDQSGKIVSELQYDKIEVDEASHLLLVAVDQKSGKPFTEYKYGLVDYHNKVRIAVEYEELRAIGRYYFGKKNGLYFLMDNAGKTVRSYPYTYMYYGNNYFIAMNKSKLYGVVDLQDNVKIPFKHPDIRPTGRYYFATYDGIYTAENEKVFGGNVNSLSVTNNLTLRKTGIFAYGLYPSEIFTDRYGNVYYSKKN